ncbi:hypothetical protein [Leptolyngbya sp. 'hensonii']|uniref:hypothetical protein n=1 Tax=Leptolyngbya sp. 'hensonii' TaxID=1922337 RepID=UPI00117E7477|nr:hypothetical protein [Leptolyngbya sp. 'hensonii']
MTHSFEIWAYRQGLHPYQGQRYWTPNIMDLQTTFALFKQENCTPVFVKAGPPPPPPKDDCEVCMSCCCSTSNENEELMRQILAQLRKLNKAVGSDQLPATLPATLLTGKDSPVRIESLADWLAWFVGSMDGVVGQFPVEVEIQDTDPTKSGNQSKRISLPNISEALAEIYGLTLNGAIDSDLSINMLTRVLAEIVATKNAAIVTQDYARGNAEFLGYRGNHKTREIDYAVNPTKLDSLEDLLQQSKQKIVGWENEEKDTLFGAVAKLLFAAGIIKAVFYRTDRTHGAGSAIKSLVELVDGDRRDNRDEWEQFVQDLEDPNSRINRGKPTPRVTDLSPPEVK